MRRPEGAAWHAGGVCLETGIDTLSLALPYCCPSSRCRLGATKGVEELREHPFLKASKPTEKSPLADLVRKTSLGIQLNLKIERDTGSTKRCIVVSVIQAQSHKERLLQTRVKADVLWTNLTSSSFPGDPIVFKGF